MTTARLYICAICRLQVLICSPCDRGNIYCSGKCAAIARVNSIHSANQRYQNTRRGKMLHADRQHRYRQRNCTLLATLEKIVTDHGSKVAASSISLPVVNITVKSVKKPDIHIDIFCDFCGCQCSNLLRRGFLRTTTAKKLILKAGFPHGP